MSPIDLPKIYNPQNQTKDELINNFVVRMGLFQDIFNEIKTSKMQHPEQHYIIQGVRGQGKTSLLLRIAYEIEQDKELNKKLIPIVFSEEQYKVRKLYKLWEETASYLEKQSGFENLYTEIQNIDFEEDFEERCFQLLENTLKKNNKKLVLFIDNIADMLNKFTKSEHHRLREILIESAEIRIIGASSESLEFHHDYGKPFYKFFRMPVLKGLNQKETNILLKSLGEKYKRERVKDIVKNQPGRIEALRRMTGGVIRTIIILYQIFVDDENGNAFQDLEKILDEVTPLYKHRMDNLSAQQQEIVDIIALNWDAISTKDIATKAREKSKAISAQLKTLILNQVIEQQGTKTKNYLYRLSERFFNIWYLMRHGNKRDENKVKFLVEFLQCWCDEKTLENKAKKHLNAIQKGKIYDKHALYMTEALAWTAIKGDLQDKLIKSTRAFLESKKSNLLVNLHPSDAELKQEAIKAAETNDIDSFIKKLEKVKFKNSMDLIALGESFEAKNNLKEAEKYYLMAVAKKDVDAMFSLAMFYENKIKDIFKAEKYYLMAADRKHANSLNNLAVLYGSENQDIKKVKKYYIMAIDNGSEMAMFNLALLYDKEIKDLTKAEKYYLMAIEKGFTDAILNLAILYSFELKDLTKAEKYYIMAAEKDSVIAMFNLAFLYHVELKDFKKAKKYYLMAIEKKYIGAMNNLAQLYENELKDFKKAEKYYLMAIKKKDASAMNNLARLYYYELKEIEKAKKYCLMAISEDNIEATFGLAIIYHAEFKDFKKAEEYYLIAIGKEHVGAMNNLAQLYQNELKDFKKAEKYFLMATVYDKKGIWNELSWMYFEDILDKLKALEYARKGYEIEKTIYIAHTYSMILLWNNEIEKALKISKDFMDNGKSYEEFPKDISQFLMLLIAKKQYHSVLKIFNENSFQLKDRFKPVYYALMFFMQNEYPNEYIKMGSELKQTVEEIIEEIKKLVEKYK